MSAAGPASASASQPGGNAAALDVRLARLAKQLGSGPAGSVLQHLIELVAEHDDRSFIGHWQPTCKEVTKQLNRKREELRLNEPLITEQTTHEIISKNNSIFKRQTAWVENEFSEHLVLPLVARGVYQRQKRASNSIRQFERVCACYWWKHPDCQLLRLGERKEWVMDRMSDTARIREWPGDKEYAYSTMKTLALNKLESDGSAFDELEFLSMRGAMRQWKKRSDIWKGDGVDDDDDNTDISDSDKPEEYKILRNLVVSHDYRAYIGFWSPTYAELEASLAKENPISGHSLINARNIYEIISGNKEYFNRGQALFEAPYSRNLSLCGAIKVPAYFEKPPLSGVYWYPHEHNCMRLWSKHPYFETPEGKSLNFTDKSRWIANRMTETAVIRGWKVKRPYDDSALKNQHYKGSLKDKGNAPATDELNFLNEPGIWNGWKTRSDIWNGDVGGQIHNLQGAASGSGINRSASSHSPHIASASGLKSSGASGSGTQGGKGKSSTQAAAASGSGISIANRSVPRHDHAASEKKLIEDAHESGLASFPQVLKYPTWEGEPSSEGSDSDKVLGEYLQGLEEEQTKRKAGETTERRPSSTKRGKQSGWGW